MKQEEAIHVLDRWETDIIISNDVMDDLEDISRKLNQPVNLVAEKILKKKIVKIRELLKQVEKELDL